MKSLEETVYTVLLQESREDCIELINTHKEAFSLYTSELNTLVLLFNRILSQDIAINESEQTIPNTNLLLLAVPNDTGLPIVSKLNKSLTNQDWLAIKSAVIEDQTITDLRFKPHMLIPYSLVVSYHHAINTTQAFVGSQNTSITAMLIELAATLASKGITTNIFHSTKHLLKTNPDDIFSKSLYKKIKRL